MSASRWNTCPVCEKRAIESAEPFVDDNTLREDIHIHLNADGRSEINYHASCAECGIDYQFNRSPDGGLVEKFHEPN